MFILWLIVILGAFALSLGMATIVGRLLKRAAAEQLIDVDEEVERMR